MSADTFPYVYYSSNEEDEFPVAVAPAMPLTSSPPSKKKGKVTKKRKRVGRACVFCQRSHMSCDEQRPCKRCVGRGCGDQCRDGKRKRRGRRPKGRTVSDEIDEYEPGFGPQEADELALIAEGHNSTDSLLSHLGHIRVVETDLYSDDEEEDYDDADHDEHGHDHHHHDHAHDHFEERKQLQAVRFKQERHGLLQQDTEHELALNEDEDSSSSSSVTLGTPSGRSSPAFVPTQQPFQRSTPLVIKLNPRLSASKNSGNAAQGLVTAPEPSPGSQSTASQMTMFPGLWEQVTAAQAHHDGEGFSTSAPSDIVKIEETAQQNPIDIDQFFQMDYLSHRAPTPFEETSSGPVYTHFDF